MTRTIRFRIHDLEPLPPVTIVPETCSASGPNDLSAILIRQREIIRRQQQRIAELQRQLEVQTLRAEYATARADGLEEQHQRLLDAFNNGEDVRPLLATPLTRPKLWFWLRLLRRNRTE
jgi:hypothetical protein